uniref:Uncharacterized protein n=1 Tax=Rhizophora mucronata TaxID=61149 RepID=A0A2P2IRP3_RHIMU
MLVQSIILEDLQLFTNRTGQCFGRDDAQRRRQERRGQPRKSSGSNRRRLF